MIHGFDDTDKSKKEVLEKSQAATKTDISNLQNQVNNHNHDSRYYTKSQTDQKIDAKALDVSGAASTIVKNNLTANKVLVSNSSGKVGASSIAASLLNYLSGLTSNIQSQLNNKAAANHNHDSAYAAKNHNHDTSYYTKAQTNSAISTAIQNTKLIGGRASSSNLEIQVRGEDGVRYRILATSSGILAFQYLNSNNEWISISTWT